MELVAFGHLYFTDQNGPNGGPHENEFWEFPKLEMNITNRAEKVDEKMGSFL